MSLNAEDERHDIVTGGNVIVENLAESALDIAIEFVPLESSGIRERKLLVLGLSFSLTS
jgi:hypothetical protein